MTAPAPTGTALSGTVLVNYADPDRTLALQLASALLRRGINLGSIPSDVPDSDYSRLKAAVADAAVVVAVWSVNSAQSPMIVEATIARQVTRLISVLLDGYDALPDGFRDSRTLDLQGWRGDPTDKRIDELAALVRELLASPPLDVELKAQIRAPTATRVAAKTAPPGDEQSEVPPVQQTAPAGTGTPSEPRPEPQPTASPAQQAPATEPTTPTEPTAATERTTVSDTSPSTEQAPQDSAVEPVLVGNVDSDLVIWDRTRPLVDRLQVDTYVTMLATVMATRDTPLPLSIGLFGEWGSGKSYFMGLLQQRVASLAADARANPDSPFCAEVVPVRFNAWHYADANLWASLAVELFEQLAGDEQQEQEERDKARTTLLTRLRTYEEAKAALTEDERRAAAALDAAEAALKRATDQEQESKDQLAGVRAQDVAKAVPEDPRVKPLIEQARAEVNKAGVQLQASPDLADLHRVAGELAGLATDLPRLWRKARERSGRMRLVLVAGAALAAVLAVAGVALLVLPGLLRWGVSALLTAIAAAAAVARPVARVAAGARAALRQVEQTIEVADRVWQQAEQRRQAELAALHDDVERAAAESRALSDRVAQAQQQVEQTQREIKELGAGRRLYRFIAERAASEDYRRQLGVVSLIREDFEELTRRLRARRDEGSDEQGDDELPSVERIVLYIDDLDRCPPERVVQVLEAVHLLLAMDLFVVVVGVDPRWLLRCLHHQFQNVLTDQPTGGPTSSDGYRRSTPQDYLEKIFQIPFVLPAMTPDGFAALLRSMVRVPSTPGQPAATDGSQAEQLDAGAAATTIVAEAHSPAVQVAAGRTPERLDLTDAELAFFTGLALLVRTPRTAKRMLNIYRMLRVTRDLSPASRFLGTPEHGGEYQAVVQLLAVLAGYPRLFRRLCRGDHETDGWPLLRRDPDESWSAFVDKLAAQAGPLRDAGYDDWRNLAAALRAIQPTVTLADRIQPYQEWAQRICRFSFFLPEAV